MVVLGVWVASPSSRRTRRVLLLPKACRNMAPDAGRQLLQATAAALGTAAPTAARAVGPQAAAAASTASATAALDDARDSNEEEMREYSSNYSNCSSAGHLCTSTPLAICWCQAALISLFSVCLCVQVFRSMYSAMYGYIDCTAHSMAHTS